MPATLTKLAPLRSRLGDLRRRRTTVRLATGFAGFAAATLVVLWLAFLVDLGLEMGRLERLVSFAAVAGALWFAAVRWLKPFLGQQESDLDMAILVESRMKIDSDLVAALQFEQPEATRWGSGQLRGAVIDYVADFGNSVDVFQGLSIAELRRRAIFLGVAFLIWVPFAILFPRHIPIFVERLFLSSQHYPTKTQITQIRVNDNPAREAGLRMQHGKPLKFEVTTAGADAAEAELRLRPRLRADAGIWARLIDALAEWAFAGSAPVVDTAASTVRLKKTAGKSGVTFTGQTAPITEPLQYQIFAGDAWTDPAPIDIVPLPVISLTMKVTPPEYARKIALPPTPAGSQVVSVVEGSRVDLSIESTNKPLVKVTLKIDGKSFPLKKAGEGDKVWNLSSEGTLFANVKAPVAFTINVEDTDGLALERPLIGHVRLLADREPRVAAAIITERVLPTGHPTIGYKATDDFGIAEIKLHREIERAEGGVEKASDVTLIKVPPADQPVQLLPVDTEGLRVELKPLKLQKGDKVRVTVEVVDYRGRVPGKSAFSEPVVFQVTDQSGILEGLSEADQKSARQLDVIIQRQLGIGENR